MNEAALCNILRRPCFTEKGGIANDRHNTYVFEVAKDATKPQVKEAIEKIFKVDVVGVTTLIVKGKQRRTRFGTSKKRSWKKAYIRIAEGKTIEVGGTI